MNLAQGLYVTVMGMGLVFLSLAMLMAAVMLLDRLFPYREPAGAAEGEAKAGRPGGAGAPPLDPPPAPTPVSRVARAFEATLGGQQHRVELKDLASQPMLVSVDGQEYRVEQRNGGSPQLLIDGQAYPAKVVEAAPDHVVVAIGEQTFRVELPALASAAPEKPAAAAPDPAPAAPPAEGTRVLAPLPGRILRVVVATGDRVARGQELCVVEAMKMENSIRAPRDGVVREVRVQAGQSVGPGELLLVI